MRQVTRIPWFYLMILLMVWGSAGSSLLAQTGKIAGRIVDAQSRQSLAGVNVVVVGTTLGAATDTEGDYFIINIPPGTYTLQASMIGYATQSQTDVRVQIDRTTVLDFQMGTQAVQGEAVTISAERELIQMDLSGSATHIDAAEFTDAPVSNVASYLMIQEGVQYQSNSDGAWLSIRGGGMEETDFLVDGQSTMMAMQNTAYMGVSRTAIREVAIQTGGFNAEYGRVRSGFVNVVTRDGSREEYSLALEGKYSFPHLKHFGRNLYDRSNPYYIISEGRSNFIPTEKIRQDGSYTLANGQFVDGVLWGLNGEVVIDVNSPEYRGWDWVEDAEGNFSHYVDKQDVSYTQEEMDRYGMTPSVYHEDLEWEGWKTLSDLTFTNDNPNSVSTLRDNRYPADLVAEWMSFHRGYEYGQDPDYDMDVTLTGPLPGARMNNRLGELLARSTFMLSYRSQTSRYMVRRSTAAYRDKNLQAKITTSVTPSTKFRLTALYGETHGFTGQYSARSVGGFYEGDDTLGGGQVYGAVTGEQTVSGGGFMPGFSALFQEGGNRLDDNYIFQSSARLTHTVNPSTYLELEFNYQHQWNSKLPMWTADDKQADVWAYNIDGLVNDRGEPRTFLTTDPSAIFVGEAQYMDPIAKADLTHINARGREYAVAGENLQWVYSHELLSQWFDDRSFEAETGNKGRKGPSRLDMARAYAGVPGYENVDLTDPALLPGSFDLDNPWNRFYRSPITGVQLPAHGGLIDGETQPGITLVDALPYPGGLFDLSTWGLDRNQKFYIYGPQGGGISYQLGRMTSGSMTVVSQIEKHNQIKAGVDFRFYQANFIGLNGQVDRFPQTHSEGRESYQDVAGFYIPGVTQYDDNPVELAAYLQDKIEVQGLIANIGMRLDVLDPTTETVDFRNPFTDSYKAENKYVEASSRFDNESKVKARVKFKWSPRIGLSYPVTETSKVYFNYGWFWQRPNLPLLFEYFGGGEGTTDIRLPNANLEWPRTIQMEMGYEQNIKGWFLLHAAGFYKDSDNLQTGYTYRNRLGDIVVNTRGSNAYSDVRGLEFRVDKNYGLFRTRVNYNILLRTRGTAGATVFYEDRAQQLQNLENVLRSYAEIRPETLPNLRGTIGLFTPRNWGPRFGDRVHPLDNIVINAIYTWQESGDYLLAEGVTADENIYINRVDRTNTSLRAEKRIGIGRNMNLGIFMQVFNLWNQKYLSEANEEYIAALTVDDLYGEWKPGHLNETLDWYRDNMIFLNKRDVFYGLTFTVN